MKTKDFGRVQWSWEGVDCVSRNYRPSPSFGTRDYRTNRMNGNDGDAPHKKDLPCDGKYTWIKGNEHGDVVYGAVVYGDRDAKVKYEYELRYDEGPGDRAWMEERDKNYLTRIFKEGKLRELEPAVWCLREMDHAQKTDFGVWWSQWLKRTTSSSLGRAEQDYKQFVEREAQEAQKREAAEKQRQEREQAKVILKQQREEKREQKKRARLEQKQRKEQQRKQAKAKVAEQAKAETTKQQKPTTPKEPRLEVNVRTNSPESKVQQSIQEQIIERIISIEEADRLRVTSTAQLQVETSETKSSLTQQLESDCEALEKRIQELEQRLKAASSTTTKQRQTELETELADIHYYQQILLKAYQVKKQKQEVLQQFQSNSNLSIYYRTIYIGLEGIFIGSKAAASEFVDVTAGNVAQGGKVVGVLGGAANAIPIFGGAVQATLKGVIIGMQLIDKKRRDNTVKLISTLATLTELGKVCESVARQLTEWYKPQLLQLVTSEDIQRQKVVSKAKRFVLKAEEYPPAKQFAEFGILWLSEVLKNFGKIDDATTLDAQLVKVITTHPAPKGLVKIKRNLSANFGIGIVRTKDDTEWSLDEIYTKSGIKVRTGADDQYEYYTSEEVDPNRYDYCVGTFEAAQARGLKLIKHIGGSSPQAMQSPSQPASELLTTSKIVMALGTETKVTSIAKPDEKPLAPNFLEDIKQIPELTKTIQNLQEKLDNTQKELKKTSTQLENLQKQLPTGSDVNAGNQAFVSATNQKIPGGLSLTEINKSIIELQQTASIFGPEIMQLKEEMQEITNRETTKHKNKSQSSSVQTEQEQRNELLNAVNLT